MKATISIFAVLAIALTVQAKPVDSAMHARITDGEIAKGDATPFTPIVTPVDNNCTDVTDAGVLPGSCCWGMPMSTIGMTDDFDNGGLCAGGEYSTGGGGQDSVVMFQPDANGLWNFWTCGTAGWDTTLQVFRDGGAGCPTTPAAWAAQAVGCNGDGCGAPPWESDLYVVLLAGETYYLVLDGWSAGYSGSATIVFYNSAPLCTNDAFCDDGLACTGAETCDHRYGPDPDSPGQCLPGPGSPCLSYQTCEEAAPYDCIDPDPCTVFDSGVQDSSYFGPPSTFAASRVFTDVAIREGGGRELISYDVCISGRNQALPPFDVTVQLWNVEPTTNGGGICLPSTPIPGTACTYTQAADVGGTPCHPYTCMVTPGAVIFDTESFLPTIETAPFNDTRCGIDLFIEMDVPDTTQSIGPGSCLGWPLMGHSPWVYVFDPESGGMQLFQLYDDSYAFGWWSGGDTNVQGYAVTSICTVPVGACCFDDGGCAYETDADCAAAGGTYDGLNTLPDPHLCVDDDGDGFFNTCDNCPLIANPTQADCNNDGEGNACDLDAGEVDGDGDGCCDNADACPADPYKCANSGQCGCGQDEIDTDGDGTMNCIDGCPLDAGKIAPGCCGCGFADTDVDGDGYMECAPNATPADPTCVDTCPNVDDAQFGPCDPGTIPTVSEWGLVVMALLLLVAGKVYFGRRTVTG